MNGKSPASTPSDLPNGNECWLDISLNDFGIGYLISAESQLAGRHNRLRRWFWRAESALTFWNVLHINYRAGLNEIRTCDGSECSGSPCNCPASVRAAATGNRA